LRRCVRRERSRMSGTPAGLSESARPPSISASCSRWRVSSRSRTYCIGRRRRSRQTQLLLRPRLSRIAHKTSTAVRLGHKESHWTAAVPPAWLWTWAPAVPVEQVSVLVLASFSPAPLFPESVRQSYPAPVEGLPRFCRIPESRSQARPVEPPQVWEGGCPKD